MADETTSMRDTLSAAYDAQVQAAEQTATPAPAETVKTETAPPAKAETTSTAAERARDDKGRFAPKTSISEPSKPGEESATAAETAAPEPSKAKAEGAAPPPSVPSAEATSPKFKPPQAWKATLREKWGTLPAEVQEEIDRREREITKSLSETAHARQFAQQFQQTIQPYEAIIRANGHHPMQTVGNLLQTAATLQLGTAQQKAAVVAQVIKGYGIDIDSLAQALEQPGQPAQQARPPQHQDPAAIARQVFQEQIAQAQQARQAKELETFKTSHEFFDDVRDTMADLIEAASRRGQALSLEDAYKRAVALDPELSKVLDQRKAAEAARAQAEAAEKARAAASSVRSSPVAAGGAPKPKDRREALAAAWDAQSSR